LKTGVYYIYSDSIIVQTGCNYTVINSYSGRFTSPGYPGNYDHLEKCSWALTAPNQRISLTFESFNTELRYDYVRLYDGNSSSSPLLAQFHGDRLPSNITTSSSTKLYITFTTDGSNVRTGFSAKYQLQG